MLDALAWIGRIAGLIVLCYVGSIVNRWLMASRYMGFTEYLHMRREQKRIRQQHYNRRSRR